MNNLASIFDPNSPVLISLPFFFSVFKILFLIAFGLYIVMALVIVRQLELMSRSVTTHLESFLKILGWLHLIAAILVWLTALIA